MLKRKLTHGRRRKRDPEVFLASVFNDAPDKSVLGCDRFRVIHKKILHCRNVMCNGIHGAFAISLGRSVCLYNDEFRIVVDPYGSDTVAEAAAYDELHAFHIMHALIILREEFEFGRDQSALAGNNYLSAVIVSGEDEISTETLVEAIKLRLVSEHDHRFAVIERRVGAEVTERRIGYSGDDVSVFFDISVVKEDHAESVHLRKEIIEPAAVKTVFVIARNIING